LKKIKTIFQASSGHFVIIFLSQNQKLKWTSASSYVSEKGPKVGWKVGHLLVDNQKTGQKIQKCAFWSKSRFDFDLPISSDQNLPGLNFINILRTNFLYERHFGSFYYIHVTRKKLPKWRSFEKISAFNVDEIDTWKLDAQFFTVEVVLQEMLWQKNAQMSSGQEE